MKDFSMMYIRSNKITRQTRNKKIEAWLNGSELWSSRALLFQINFTWGKGRL